MAEAEQGFFKEEATDQMLTRLAKRLVNSLIGELPAEALAMTVLFWLTGKRKETLTTKKDGETVPIVDLRGELMADLVEFIPNKEDPFWVYLRKAAAEERDNDIIIQLIKVPNDARKIFFEFMSKLDPQEMDYTIELLRHNRIGQLLKHALYYLYPKWKPYIEAFEQKHRINLKLGVWVKKQGEEVENVLHEALSQIEKKQIAGRTHRKEKKMGLFLRFFRKLPTLSSPTPMAPA